MEFEDIPGPKPEPLKGKVHESLEQQFFSYDDVKSAIEWLKGEWDRRYEDDWTVEDFEKVLNEAFEDVLGIRKYYDTRAEAMEARQKGGMIYYEPYRKKYYIIYFKKRNWKI